RCRRVGAPGAPSPPAGGVLGPRGESDSSAGLATVAFGGQEAGLVATVRRAGSSRARAGFGRAGCGERARPGGGCQPGTRDRWGSAGNGEIVVESHRHETDLRVAFRYR